MLYGSYGILKYFSENEKIIVELEKDFAQYYISLIPKYIFIRPQRYLPHISISRNENILSNKSWNKYNNKIVEFKYDSEIKFNEEYFWLAIYCDELKIIREELGLPKTKIGITFSPDEKDEFHITIGNKKNIK